MPKQKTHKGAKKRFRVSKKGKVTHKRAGMSHLMSSMTGKRKRQLRKKGSIAGKDLKMIVSSLQGKG